MTTYTKNNDDDDDDVCIFSSKNLLSERSNVPQLNFWSQRSRKKSIKLSYQLDPMITSKNSLKTL